MELDLILPFALAGIGYFGTWAVDRRKRPALVGGGVGGLLGVLAMVII